MIDEYAPTLFAQKVRELTNFLVRIPEIAYLFWMLLSGLLFAPTVNSAESTTYDFSPSGERHATQRVLVAVEMRGELKVQAEGGKVDRLPLEGTGKLDYDEKLLQATADPWLRRSVRYYRQAEAHIKVGKGINTPKFDEPNRLICVQVDQQSALIYSPLGPLTREQLELLDVQANSLVLPSVLPDRPVRVGDQWRLDDRKLAPLVGLDVITKSSVRATLAEVDGGTALIELAGQIAGGAGGVSSEIKLRAKCNFDLRRKQITWFAASIAEQRAIGHAEPGLDVTARVRVALAPTADSPQLSDRLLAELPLEPSPGCELLKFESGKAHVRLVHDRRWHVMMDRHDLVVLRFVDQGDLVAQCNVSPLPDLEAGKQLPLEAFQADVQRSLGEHFGQIVEASQWEAEDGKRILRIVAAGMASDVPIQWTYYHVSNSQGRRAAIAFTLASKLVERFAEADQTLIGTFGFLPRPKPTEAPASREAEIAQSPE